MKKVYLILTIGLLGFSFGVSAQTQVPENSSSPIYYKDGKVGIGTATPLFKLHITDRIKLDGENAGMWIENGMSDWFFGRYGNNLRFNHGGDRLTLTPDGKVGIGTGTPLYLLDVQGRSRFFDGANLDISLTRPGGENGIVFNVSEYSGYSRFNIWNHKNTTDSERYLELRYNTDNSGIAIRKGGKVGIGTTSPQYLLDVNGSMGVLLGADKFYFYPGYTFDERYAGIRTNNGSVAMNAKEGGTLFFNRDVTGDVRIQSNAVDIATFFSDGKVGIGTGAPNYKLHIKDDVENSVVRTEHNDKYANVGANSYGGFLGASNDNGELTVNIRGYGKAYFNAGNVGIGTTNPTHTLTVDGKIKAEEIIVADVDGADFVFESDYQLPSLQETENFIKANKHLPGIPSAKQMQEDGLTIGEMNIMLLQKIEELTLYSIHQESEINKLYNEVDQLKEMISDILNGK